MAGLGDLPQVELTTWWPAGAWIADAVVDVEKIKERREGGDQEMTMSSRICHRDKGQSLESSGIPKGPGNS